MADAKTIGEEGCKKSKELVAVENSWRHVFFSMSIVKLTAWSRMRPCCTADAAFVHSGQLKFYRWVCRRYAFLGRTAKPPSQILGGWVSFLLKCTEYLLCSLFRKST